jgi:hypothetical protein
MYALPFLPFPVRVTLPASIDSPSRLCAVAFGRSAASATSSAFTGPAPSTAGSPSDLAAWRARFLRLERERDAERTVNLIITSTDDYDWSEPNLRLAAFVVRRAAPGREYRREHEPLVCERVCVAWLDEGADRYWA